MSSVEGLPVIQYFADISGKSLDDGFVYIGTSGIDPVANPISVFWDAALTIPAPNPIRTRNGHPDRSGVPSRFFVDADSYSFAVKNKNGTTIYSALDSLSATDIERRLSNNTDTAQGASLIGYRGLDARKALDLSIDVRAFGAKGDGLIGSGAANLAALQSAVAANGSGVYRFKWTPNDANTFVLSDSWNIVDHDDVTVWIDPGVIVKTVAPTTFGHVICIGAGTPLGGISTGRVRNVGFMGGGQVLATGSGTADNGIGFLRVADAFVIGMDIPTCDRKAITFQTNDATGDPAKFNGNIWILNNKLGATGHHAVTVEGGCNGTVFVDGNTCEQAGLDFLHFTGANVPAVDIRRVILGQNVCKLAGAKGIFAFRVLDLIDNGSVIESATERGVDASTCGNVHLRSRAKSTGSWGVRVSSCTGDISLADGFKATTSAVAFPALDLTSNTKDALISSAILGDGAGTYALTATGKSALLSGTQLTSGTSGLTNGVAPSGRFFANAIYNEAVDGVIYKVPGASILFADGATTPSVADALAFKTQNTGATTITNFTNGRDGQRITIGFNDTLTTIQDNANIKLAGSVNFTPTAGNDTISFIRLFSTWLETGRSDN